MKATGERFISDEAWGYRSEIEHRHRYHLLNEVVKDKNVLDAACGSGYGSYIISQNAHTVVGIDISQEAIDFCKGNYRNHNLKFIQMSAAKMDFEDNSFDVVISFETIEHLPYALQCDFLKEITRILKKDGLLIMSSPDRNMCQIANQGANNPYHIHEFSYGEFKQFLFGYFNYVKFAAQNIVEVSWISPENEAEGNSNVMLSKHFEGTLPSKCVIAICSCCKGKIDDVEFRSFYVPNIMQYFHETFDVFNKACLYRDIGSGFTEADKLEEMMVMEADTFYVKYKFENCKCTRVRFDPCERFCKISCLEIKSSCGVKVNTSNADNYEDGVYTFLNPDPSFILDLPASDEKIIVLEFSGKIQALNEHETYALHKKLDAENDMGWLDTMAVCYYDTGRGYNENEKMYASYCRTGNLFRACFQLPQNLLKFRIDPCLQGRLPLWYRELKINGKPVNYQEENIVEINKKKSFCGKIPYFVFHEAGGYVEFELWMYNLDIEDFKTWIQKDN